MNRDLILAELRRVRKDGAKHVTDEDLEDIADLPELELRRRAVRGRDWHRLFASCLDGIPAIRNLPGSCPDGCWEPRRIRAVVEHLVQRGGQEMYLTAAQTEAAMALGLPAAITPEELGKALLRLAHLLDARALNKAVIELTELQKVMRAAVETNSRARVVPPADTETALVSEITGSIPGTVSPDGTKSNQDQEIAQC